MTSGAGRAGDQGRHEESFAAALAACRAAPERPEAWAAAEELADSLQRPDDLAAVYRDVLELHLAQPVRQELARRAAQFHEAWFGDDADAMGVLLARIIELDPEAQWAFERYIVVLTVAERWDVLLDVYDRMLSHTSDVDRRRTLLDEAAHLAKDFAGDPGRAVDYMQLELELDPNNAALVAGIERLLERQRRWEDLIEMWQGRVLDMPTAEARATRIRIATTFMDHLDAPGPALEELRTLVTEAPGHAEGSRMLERILAQDGAPVLVRLGALSLLRISYDALGRPDDVVTALLRALEFAEDGEQLALHREVGARLAIASRSDEAMAHYATLLRLEPGDIDARKQLRQLAQRAGLHRAFAEALAEGAGSAEGAQRMALRYEAAQVFAEREDDAMRAAELLAEVVAEGESDRALALSAAHQLAELLARAGRDEERLAVLEQLASLEHSASLRRAVLGEAGRLADALGDPDRALAAYARRLGDDPADGDALDATIAVLEQQGRHEALATALEQRAVATALPQQRRADRVRRADLLATRLGDLEGAVTTWTAVRREFGDEPETVDALDALLAQLARMPERGELATVAATSIRDRACALSVRLGDVRRTDLGEGAAAAAAYADALAIDPAARGALAGLRALLDDPAAGRIAGESLAGAMRRTGDWQGLLGLVDARIRRTGDPLDAIAVLREAANLHERAAGEPGAALEAIAHAFTLDPTDTGLEHELMRLGTATEQWTLVADAYHTATAVAAHPARAAHLHLAEGRIRELELHDATGAATAYAAAATHDPEALDVQRAVVRAAATAGRWDTASAGALAICSRRESIDPDAIASLMNAVSALDQWPGFVAAFEAAFTTGSEALDTQLARDLDLLCARWYRDECQDQGAATTATARAVARAPQHVPALELLADLQRTAGADGLIATLVALDRACDGDIVHLREAAELACTAGIETPAARSLVTALHHKSSHLLHTGDDATRDAAAASVRWALERIVEGSGVTGPGARASMDALLSTAALPLPRPEILDLRIRAARISAGLGAVAPAIDLLREVLAERTNDAALVAELAALCEREGRILELVHLRTRELELTSDPPQRLALRLELSRLVGELERRGGRVESLQRNLAEQPGHGPSVEALSHILEDKGRHGQLCDIVEQQAATLGDGDAAARTRAAELWAMAAGIAADRLTDTGRAIAALTRQVALVPDNEALDTLARLHLARNEPGAAATCLQQRLATTEAGARVPVLLRLARAQLQAELELEATATLEVAFGESPRNGEVRKLLLRLYRTHEQWEPLARALVTAAEVATDPAAVVAYAREAAEIYGDRLGAPDKAVPVLERAVALGEADRSLRARLGDGLRVAGRLDEAATALGEVIADYGRRRSPERAAAHLLLARVLHARNDRAAALDHLELAAGMDAGNPAIMQMLAETAHENGQLERAERSYRALLIIARRSDAEPASTAFGAAQVLVELASIANERGQRAQAQELIESALEALANDDSQAPALQRMLALRGDDELLRRVLEARLHHVDNRRRRAEVLAELAGLHAKAGDSAAALEQVFAAIAADPGSPPVHDLAHEIATAAGQIHRYGEELEQQLEKARRTSDVHVRCELLLRLAEVHERDQADLGHAALLLAQAEATGVREIDVWRALARVAAARGDTEDQMRILERLAALGEDAAETRADALYRMAEVQLADPETTDAGLAALAQALEVDARHERANRILVRATLPERGLPRADLLAMFEQSARKAGDEGVLLLALERRATLPEATVVDVREAADLATRRGESERASALMLRAVELSGTMIDGNTQITWALLGLAQGHADAGDWQAAVQWLQEAAAAMPPEELLPLGQRIAAGADDDALTIRVYEALLERDPALRGAWEPLARLYRLQGDTDRLHRLVDETLDSLGDAAARNAMRMELVAALVDGGDARGDATAVLHDVLREEPEHPRARNMLLDMLERDGRGEEVVVLLREQLRTDELHGDPGRIADAALMLARRIHPRDPGEAAQVARAALERAPDHRALLHAAREWMSEDDFEARGALTERLIDLEPIEVAAALARELADAHAARGDYEGQLRVLVQAFRRAPGDTMTRGSLERAYEARGDYRGIAELLRTAAELEPDPRARVTILRQAATLHRELLGDPEAATALLEQAHQAVPGDAEIGLELASSLGASGQFARATAVLGALIDAELDDRDRLMLLTARAQLRTGAGDHDAAVADLEGALAIDSAEVAPSLLAGLHAQRDAAQAAGDADIERASTLRIVELLTLQQRRDEARAALAQWLERDRKDCAALQLLVELDTLDERWDAVVKSCARLVAIEQGEAQITAALQLAAACRELGRPEDAKAGLEHARRKQPGNVPVREALREVYAQIGADRELARLLAAEAEDAVDDETRIGLLRQASALFMEQGDTEAALPLVRALLALQPDDFEAGLVLIDAYVVLGEIEPATAVLEAMAGDGRDRRATETAAIHHRRARIAGSRGAHDEQLTELQTAFGHDKNDGVVASELADLAEALEQWDLAVRVLRQITLIDGPCPVTRTSAFLRQAKIAHRRGDRQRAVLWARKAKHEAPDSTAAGEFLAELGEA